MAGLVSVNKLTQPNTPGSPARPQAPRDGPSIEARESIREVDRGASGDLQGLSGEAMHYQVDGHVHGPPMHESREKVMSDTWGKAF